MQPSRRGSRAPRFEGALVKTGAVMGNSGNPAATVSRDRIVADAFRNPSVPAFSIWRGEAETSSCRPQLSKRAISRWPYPFNSVHQKNGPAGRTQIWHRAG